MAKRLCYFLFEDDGVNVEMSVVAPHGWVFAHEGSVMMTSSIESVAFTACQEEGMVEQLFVQFQKGLRTASNVRADNPR